MDNSLINALANIVDPDEMLHLGLLCLLQLNNLQQILAFLNLELTFKKEYDKLQ